MASFKTGAAVLAFVLYIASTVAQPAPGLASWCAQPAASLGGNHGSSASCGVGSPCSMGDKWWTNTDTCIIPGSTAYPVWSKVVGGDSGLFKWNLTQYGNSANVLGTIYVWRTYNDKLGITISLDGNPSYQPVFDRNYGDMGLSIWPSIDNYQRMAYNSTAMISPSLGRFTCMTMALDLKQVCNPFLSYYNVDTWGPGYCRCSPGYSTCAPSDLTQGYYSGGTTDIVVWLQMNVTNMDVTSCAPTGSGPTITNAREQFLFKMPQNPGAQNTPPGPPLPPSPPPPPGPPPPPSPPPSPPSPPPPSPPPNPPPPPSTAWYASVSVTSYNNLIFTPADCPKLEVPLSIFYKTRPSFSETRCQQYTMYSNTGPYEKVSQLTLFIYFNSNSTDIRYIFDSVTTEYFWTNVIASTQPGCGFTAQYLDTGGQGNFTVCTNQNCSSPGPRYMFPNLNCAPPPPAPNPPPSPPSPPLPPSPPAPPSPPTPPSPPPSPPPPSPPPAPPSPPPSPPPPPPMCPVLVMFQFGTAQNFNINNCNTLSKTISTIAPLVTPSSPYIYPWGCQAFSNTSLSTVAGMFSSQVAQEFINGMNNSQTIRLIAGLFMNLDPWNTNNGAGCGSSFTIYNQCNLPILTFNSSNLDIFSCPAPPPTWTFPSPTPIQAALAPVSIQVSTPYTMGSTACQQAMDAMQIYVGLVNKPLAQPSVCSRSNGAIGPRGLAIDWTVTLFFNSQTDADYFGIVFSSYINIFVASARVPCSSTVICTMGSSLPTFVSCGDKAVSLCCAPSNNGPFPSPNQATSPTWNFISPVPAPTPVPVPRPAPVPSPVPSPEAKTEAIRIVIQPPAGLGGQAITPPIASQFLCPRLMSSMANLMDYACLDKTGNTWSNMGCMATRDQNTKAVLYYVNLQLTSTTASKTLTFLTRPDNFAWFVQLAGVPCQTTRVVWRQSGKPNQDLASQAGLSRFLAARSGFCAKKLN